MHLGKHAFGDERFFRFDDPVAKYTLRPLIDKGRCTLLKRNAARVSIAKRRARRAAELQELTAAGNVG